MKKPNRNRQLGVTLMELMIVVAIVAMISAFAYPSYMDYVVNTKRTAAQTTLLQVMDRQQQFFMDNKRYAATLTDLGFANNPLSVADDGNTVPAGDADEVYSISLANITATSYDAVATPLGQQLRRDTKCATLTIDNSGARQASGSHPDDCW